MTDYQFDKLQALAERLGTTATHLWSVLIVQARIEFFVDLFYVAAIIGLFFAMRSLHIYARKQKDEDWMIPVLVGWIVLAILGLIIFIVCAEIPGLLLNPEYWALKQVLQAVKK